MNHCDCKKLELPSLINDLTTQNYIKQCGNCGKLYGISELDGSFIWIMTEDEFYKKNPELLEERK